jgi:hypothetical protein
MCNYHFMKGHSGGGHVAACILRIHTKCFIIDNAFNKLINVYLKTSIKLKYFTISQSDYIYSSNNTKL